MENIPTINEEVDDPTCHVRTACLRTPVILRVILQQLPNRELIKLSLVNKQWNFEARSVLKNRGTLNAVIWSEKHPGCEDLENFASDLRQMQVVPFAGMSLTVYHQDQDACCQSTYDYNTILERIPFKNLSVQFLVDWDERSRSCPAVALVKKILEGFGQVIEKLTLASDVEEVDLLRHVAPRNCSFPRLKTLELESNVEDDIEDFTDFVKKMVSGAPNLEELHLLYLNWDENVLEGSSAVLVPCRSHFNPLHDQVGQSVVGLLRPQSLELKQSYWREFDPQLLHSLIPRVLQASRTSLKALRMDLLLTVPLMCYRICLENVTTLEVRVEADLDERVKLFDFTRVFPKLNKVEIINDERRCSSKYQIRKFVKQWNKMSIKTSSDRAINIKHLALRGSAFDSSVPFWAEIFPHVKTLAVALKPDSSPIPCTLLWDHFKYLEELEVEHTKGPRTTVANLDSVFCGLLPEEIDELREMDDEYLKAVNIVPVMPSITCMKGLKKFKFRYDPESYNVTRGDPNFIFSKVTGLIGFARCPSLTVTFETDSRELGEEALCHMKPFASFAYGDPVSSPGTNNGHLVNIWDRRRVSLA